MLVALAASTAALCSAQETKPEHAEPKFYKLDFVLKEVDGKRILNSRNYSILAATDENGSIRAREQVQVRVIPESTSYQTVDVGTDIDTRKIRELGNNLVLVVNINVNGLPQEPGATSAPSTVRHYSWSSGVLIPLRKPTTIFSSDLTTGKTQMQLELTAIPILY
jgi:hypothetical protein